MDSEYRGKQTNGGDVADAEQVARAGQEIRDSSAIYFCRPD
jgi:hypothetical protein